MALYADQERGRYPAWQSVDHPDYFPGSGVLFVTVTVCPLPPEMRCPLFVTTDPPQRAISPTG